ncbi:MAG: DUF134 domain-containing protein [Desulfovibrio sp.]|nr:DUF134 domain-containing protein [Desulfovibrio sp.]
MRPTKARTIGCMPKSRRFCPLENTKNPTDEAKEGNADAVTIGLDMLEAMRLVDAEGMNQEEAAQSMDVSTPTLCRILGQGRRLVATALINGKTILLEGGNIMYDERLQRGHGAHFCHGRQGQGAPGTCETHSHGEGLDRFQGMGRGRRGAGRGSQGLCGRKGAYGDKHEEQDNASAAQDPLAE